MIFHMIPKIFPSTNKFLAPVVKRHSPTVQKPSTYSNLYLSLKATYYKKEDK